MSLTVVKSRQVTGSGVETWFEPESKFEVQLVSQEVVYEDGKVIEFINHYNVLSHGVRGEKHGGV